MLMYCDFACINKLLSLKGTCQVLVPYKVFAMRDSLMRAKFFKMSEYLLLIVDIYVFNSFVNL